ncbi:arginine N-succinyltransferase [Aquabacterium humicola]|uniref:arginine N-succinyltransferase n=1 Tax=Aquabacterium humicola TaxID=3237377 RepID=UPI0025436544|nr:arginine N-succinyltransferase [Rubrivivax pictus]
MTLSDVDPGRFVLRPSTPDDLPAFERFAAASAHGITTLPADRQKLAERLDRSAHAFATSDDASGEEIYLFVLEDRATGGIVGTSGIAASAGFADRFYSYRNEFIVHASAALGVSNRIHTLHLCHDLTDVTLLTSFYIEPAYERTLAPQLLSRARLLFIGAHPERFSDRIAAESPGLADDRGRCPFWDAVGRRFFGVDYPEIERLAGGRSKAFIAELLPHSPVYVPLLPEEAQWAIGQLHPVAELPFSILLDEGFDADTYIDIFDGGPTVEARLAMLKTVGRMRHRQALVLREGAAAGAAPGAWQLVSTTRRDHFRAALAPDAGDAGSLPLPQATAAQLGVRDDDALLSAALDAGGRPEDE